MPTIEIAPRIFKLDAVGKLMRIRTFKLAEQTGRQAASRVHPMRQ